MIQPRLWVNKEQIPTWSKRGRVQYEIHIWRMDAWKHHNTYFCFALIYFILKLFLFLTLKGCSNKNLTLWSNYKTRHFLSLFILTILCKTMIFGLKQFLQSNPNSITHTNILLIPTSPVLCLSIKQREVVILKIVSIEMSKFWDVKYPVLFWY